MEVLKKKSIAMLIMSLIIFVALALAAKVSIGETIIILLILLVVFTVIDLIVDAKFLTERQAKFASTVVGLFAVAGIVAWGTFVGSGVPVNNGENIGQGNIPPSAAADETYELGLFYFERGDYEEAIQTLKEVADDSGSYAEAQKLLAEATDCYRNGLMDTANTYVEKDDYKLAIDILNAGLLVIPDDVKLLQTIDDYSSAYMDAVRTAAIAEAEMFAVTQDYTNALMAIQGAIDEVGDDAELQTLYNYYATQFRHGTLTEARQVYTEQGYESSLSILQNSLSVLPNDNILTAYYDVFLAHQPVRLSDLVKIDDSDRHYDYWNETSSISDLLGNEPINSNYSFGNDGWSGYSSGTGWVEFFLNKEYLIFQCSYLTRSIKPSYTFCVYGDNVELYNSGKINWEAGCQNITVNVKNVSKLKILVKWSGGATLDYGRFYMGNDLLYQELTDDDFTETHS